MTARRSRSARSAALLALAACALSACATSSAVDEWFDRVFGPREARPQYVLESPPPSDDLVGKLSFKKTGKEDTLVDLAPELGVGYVELLAANPGVDPWIPPHGTRLAIPNARLLPSGKREGIVVNLGDLRLYFFPKDGPPRAYPIGIAKDGYATPLGDTTVKAKKEKPTWIPGESARRDDPELPARVPPGPENPLGEHALYLGWQSYLIHGTNLPGGVGRHSSRGCIRLYPDDIAELYEAVEIGTPVRVVHEPVKLGWIGGELYLEVNAAPRDSLELDETGKLPDAVPPKGLREQVEKAAGKDAARVDWAKVDEIAKGRFGIPSRVTGTGPLPATQSAGTKRKASPSETTRPAGRVAK
jgi:L,D-transpeptidase ErfK/SrfK